MRITDVEGRVRWIIMYIGRAGYMQALYLYYKNTQNPEEVLNKAPLLFA